MKHNKNFMIVYTIIIAITTIVGAMLWWEYRYFKHEVQALAEVKDAYYQHVDMLKRSLNASIKNTDSESSDDIQKKKNDQRDLDCSDQGTMSGELFLSSDKEQHDFALINKEEDKLVRAIKNYTTIAPQPVLKIKKFKSRSRRNRAVKRSQADVVLKHHYSPHRDFDFAWPIELNQFWLSSLFGPRKRPNGQVEFHHAIDMAAIKGTPVKAAAKGVVVLAQTLPGYGNCVMIEHNNRYKTRYAHLHKIAVKHGQSVEVGQYIGSVGATGFVRKSGNDASHLHFEIHQDGHRVNPLAFLFS